MVFFPLIFDILQCWIIDTFLAHEPKQTDSQNTPNTSYRYNVLHSNSDDALNNNNNDNFEL